MLIMEPCFEGCVRSWDGRKYGLLVVIQELLVVNGMLYGVAEREGKGGEESSGKSPRTEDRSEYPSHLGGEMLSRFERFIEGRGGKRAPRPLLLDLYLKA